MSGKFVDFMIRLIDVRGQSGGTLASIFSGINAAPYTVALLSALGVVSFAMPSCASDSAEDKAIVDKSQALGNSKVALKMLETYLASHPDSSLAYFHAAKMSNAISDFPKTVRYATKYLSLKPSPIEYYVYHLRGHAYTCLNQADKGLSDLTIARKAEPKDAETPILMGAAHMRLGRYKEALTDYTQATKLNNIRGYDLKAQVELEKNDIRSAASDFAEYGKRGGDLDGPLATLQRITKQGKGDAAVVILDEMLRSPANPKVEERLLIFKANILYQIGRKNESLDMCDVFEKRFHKTDLYTVKYLIVWNQKKFDASLVCLNGMLKSRPYERSLYLLRGDCYRALDEYGKALADYNRVPDLVMKDLQRRRERAECNFQIGHYLEAANELDAVNSLEPTAQGYAKQGECLRELKRYKDAIVCFNRAVKMLPLNADFISFRGDCYRRLKDYPRALKDFSDAITLHPDNMLHVFGRGLCFAELNKNEDAVKDFTAAMSQPRLVSRALQERAKAYDKLGEKEKAERDRIAAKHDGRSLESDFFGGR